ncbi:MAG: FAD:protein FMN transferase [Victivallales bacterium]
MRKLIFSTVLAVLAIMLWYLTNNQKKEVEPYSKISRVMSTIAEVKFFGNRPEAEKASAIVDGTFAEIELTCNIFNPESEISKLNATAVRTPFKCSPMLWEVLDYSRKVNAISEGAFDITVKPLMSLWGFHGKRLELPDEQEVAETLKRVGLDKVVFDDAEHTVFFTCEGMSFDLGGIAKGFAVDKAVERVLNETSIRAGLVNLAGNMRALPVPPPGRKSYIIGVRNPVHKETVCGRIEFLSSIATSGDYERYTVIGGRKFTHPMDIGTGRPVEGMIAVTVVTPLATLADGFSGSTFIKGEKFARELCAKIPGTNILIIRHNPDDPQKIDIIKIGDIWGEIKL